MSESLVDADPKWRVVVSQKNPLSWTLSQDESEPINFLPSPNYTQNISGAWLEVANGQWWFSTGFVIYKLLIIYFPREWLGTEWDQECHFFTLRVCIMFSHPLPFVIISHPPFPWPNPMKWIVYCVRLRSSKSLPKHTSNNAINQPQVDGQSYYGKSLPGTRRSGQPRKSMSLARNTVIFCGPKSIKDTITHTNWTCHGWVVWEGVNQTDSPRVTRIERLWPSVQCN